MSTLKTEATYSYRSIDGFQIRFTAGYRAGQTASATLVEVTNEASGARYSCRFIDGQRPTCSCPFFHHRCSGQLGKECKHLKGAREHLMAETFAAEISPAIAEQLEAPSAVPAQPIPPCACCGAALTPETGITTVKHRDGSRTGWVCRDSGACLERQTEQREARRWAETVMTERDLLWEDHKPRIPGETSMSTQDPQAWQVVQRYCRPDGVTISHRFPERLSEEAARAEAERRKRGSRLITFCAEPWAKRTRK